MDFGRSRRSVPHERPRSMYVALFEPVISHFLSHALELGLPFHQDGILRSVSIHKPAASSAVQPTRIKQAMGDPPSPERSIDEEIDAVSTTRFSPLANAKSSPPTRNATTMIPPTI